MPTFSPFSPPDIEKLQPLVAEFRAIMADESHTTADPSAAHCRAAIERKAATLPAGPEMWALWYVQNGAHAAELCEFDGSVCFECYRDAGEARATAARLNDGASLGRYIVALVPAGIACGNEEVGTVRASGPATPWIAGMDGGFTTCTAAVADLSLAMVAQPCQQQQANAAGFCSSDAIIEAALRNDARRGLPPRYATASVTPLQAPTDQSKLDEWVGRQNAALRILTDALIDQADMVERLARKNLRGLDVRAIDAVRAKVLQAQAQLAKIQDVLLDTEDGLDLLDVDDMGTAMRTALHRITATDLSAKTDLEEHGLTASDLLGRRVG